MANALYDWGREAFLSTSLDWDTDTIKVVLCDDTDYTKNLATDDFLDDVPSGARATNGTSGAFTSKTVAAGVADAADVTLSSVTGDESEELVIFEDSGAEATSDLICNIDTATGLPITPNGGDINIQWDDGANKIFKL